MEGGEFRDLLARFGKEYVTTARGIKHLESYEESRAVAHSHWQAIGAQAEKSKDITDDVLLHLLPHLNTVGNRGRGAWVHPTPAITKDIRIWFEAARLVVPKDWPAIARAIFTFVKRCIDDPAQLSEACREFGASRYSRGFQSAFLSPILNALRPDDFVISNTKSRRILSEIEGGTYPREIEAYPSQNGALRLLASKHSESLAAAAPGFRIADVLDAFAHWFVSVNRPNVDEENGDDEETSTWIFQANPKLFDIDAALRELTRFCWQVNQNTRRVKRGHAGYLWKSGRDGGIVATFTIESDPAQLPDPPEEVQFSKAGAVDHGVRLRVWIRVDRVLPTVLSRRDIAADSRLKDLTILRFANATNYAIDPLEAQAIEELIAGEPVDVGSASANSVPQRVRTPTAGLVLRAYGVAQMAADTGFSVAVLDEWLHRLRRKRQIVLQGPPGTGKTFVARRLAEVLLHGQHGALDLVQFHPSFSYEDFIQGIRPVAKGRNLEFALEPGRFLAFCEEARKVAPAPAVLLIDEINRANLSRVFGELMYLLEYRDESIPLAAGGARFSMPSNLYLIGTMNTADRSIALVDHALRRRFSFIHLEPSYDVLRQHLQRKGLPAESLVNALMHVNRVIEDRNYHVGISFFMRLDDDLQAELPMIWRGEIEPYLEEYFYDQLAKVEPLRWQSLSGSVLREWVAESAPAAP
jgi:hypothetical protein